MILERNMLVFNTIKIAVWTLLLTGTKQEWREQ